MTLFAEVEDAEPGSPVSRFPRRRFKFPHAGCHPSHGGHTPLPMGSGIPHALGLPLPVHTLLLLRRRRRRAGCRARGASRPPGGEQRGPGPRPPPATPIASRGAAPRAPPPPPGRAKWRPRYKMAAGRAVAWGRCPRARPGFLPTLSMSSRACARHIPVNPGGPPSVDGQVRAHTGAELRRTGFGDP